MIGCHSDMIFVIDSLLLLSYWATCFLFRRRVEEFKECGDLDMMTQYVKDVQAVQKKLSESIETIGFINEVC